MKNKWVWFTSVPQQEISHLGLLLSSQGIPFIPSQLAPEEFLPLVQDQDESYDQLNSEAPGGTLPMEFTQMHLEGYVAIYLQEHHLQFARHQLNLWTRENQTEGQQKEWEHHAIPELSVAPLGILLVPTLFYILLPFAGAYPILKEAGLNNAERVLAQGEWWRLWTALTMHANHKHLLSNLLSGYFVLNLLRTRFNSSWQWLSLLAFSGLANFLVVYTHGLEAWDNHRSLGFSTFVFAALGMLAAVETKQLIQDRKIQFKKLTPFTSSLFIVVMMGLGEGSDVLAHFYGFFMGMIPGLALPQRQDHYNEIQARFKPMDLAFWVLGVGWLLICWQLAVNP